MKNKNQILDEIKIISNIYQSGNYLEVISKSKKLLHILPNNEFLNNMIGLSYINIGRLDEAKNLYLKIIKTSPSITSYQNNYANVLKGLNKFNEAETVLEKIIERKPDYINALNNLANLKKMLRKFNEAIDLFEDALKIQAENYIILYNIALCYRSLRNFEKVKSYALKINKINPNFTLADKIISEIQNYNDDKLGHYEIMEKKLINKEMKDEDRATLLFSMAKANEDLKNYEISFNYLKKANSLRRSNITYNFNSDLIEFNEIKNKFTDLKISNFGNYTSKRKIIFVCGMPRSGTTLVEQIISAHSEVQSLGETDQVQNIINENLNYLNKDFDGLLKDYDFDQNLIYDKYVRYIKSFNKVEMVYTDKSLFNFKLIGFIKLFFPNTKIIVLKRDFNNNLLSIYKSDLQSQKLSWSYDANEINNNYKLFIEYLNFWNKLFPNLFLELNYSDLINNTSNISRDIVSFCGLKWEDSCLEFYNQNKSPIDTASANQANKPVYNTSLNKFENYKEFFKLK